MYIGSVHYLEHWHASKQHVVERNDIRGGFLLKISFPFRAGEVDQAT